MKLTKIGQFTLEFPDSVHHYLFMVTLSGHQAPQRNEYSDIEMISYSL